MRGVGDGHAVGDPRPLRLELDHQVVGYRSLHACRTGIGYLDGLYHAAGDQELTDVRVTHLPVVADPQRDDRTRRIDFGGIGTVHELETAVLRIGDLPSAERVSGAGRTVERDDHLVGSVIVAGREDEEGGGGIDQGEVVDRLSLFDDGGIHQDADGYMGYLGVEDHHIVSVLLVVVAAFSLQTLHLRQIRIGVHGDGLSGGVDDLVGPVDELVTSGTVFVDLLQVVLGPLQQGHDPVSHSGDGEGVGGVEPGTELHDLAVQQVPGVVLGLGRVEIYGGVAPHELHLDVPSRPAGVQGHILGHDAGGGVPGVLVFGLGVPGEEVVSGPDRALHGSDYSAGHGDVHHGGGTVHVVHGHSVHVAGVQLEVPGDWEREGVGVVVCDVGVPAYEVVVGGRTVGEGDDGAVAVGVLQLGAVVDVEDDTDVGGLGDQEREGEGCLGGPVVDDAEGEDVLLHSRAGERIDLDLQRRGVSSLQGSDVGDGCGTVGTQDEGTQAVGPSGGVVGVLDSGEVEGGHAVSSFERRDGIHDEVVTRLSGRDVEDGAASSVDDADIHGGVAELGRLDVDVHLGLDGVDHDI